MKADHRKRRRRAPSGGVLALAGALAVSGCTGAYFAALNVGPARGIEASTHVYDAANELALDVYRPAACRGECPVVVFYYGGRWRTGNPAQYAFVGRGPARRGLGGVVAD